MMTMLSMALKFPEVGGMMQAQGRWQVLLKEVPLWQTKEFPK